MVNPEVIYGILGAVSALLTAVVGVCVKLHMNRSSCANGMCFDCICDPEELNTIHRVRTERRQSNSNNDEYIDIQPEKEQPEENIYDKLNHKNIMSV